MANTPKPPAAYVIHSAAGLAKIPRPLPVVRNFLFQNTIAAIIGAPGVCKTFIAIAIAQCIAFLQAFGDHEVDGGGVLYIVGEGVGGLQKREAAWRKYHNHPEQSPRLWFVELRGSLFEAKTLNDLRADVEALGVPLKMIVVDTLASCFVGGDESSTRDMTIICARLHALRAFPGNPLVTIVHHTPRSDPGRERGSTVLRGAVDTLLLVQPKGHKIELRTERQKDSEPHPPVYFELETVHLGTDDAGQPITSGVLVPTTPPAKGSSGETSPFCDAIVKALETSAVPLRRREILDAVEHLELGGSRQFDRALADLQERQIIYKETGHYGRFSLTSRDDIAA